jgi:hypothetical protein
MDQNTINIALAVVTVGLWAYLAYATITKNFGTASRLDSSVSALAKVQPRSQNVARQ